MAPVILDVVAPKSADFDITEAITGGELERTIEGASTLTITVHDPHRTLIRSKLLQTAIDLKYAGIWFRLVRISKADDTVTLQFEDRDVAYLRKHKRPRKVSRNSSTRAQFVRALVQEVKQRRIKFYCPEVNERQAIAGTRGATGQGARGKEILHVGDSLAVGTHPTLDGLVGATDYDGLVGRNSTQTLARMEAMLKASHKVVIFDAGSNDTNANTLKSNLIAARQAAGNRPVYALTVNSPPNTGDLNDAIKASGVRVIDWRGFAIRNRIDLDAMGIHPDAAGYRRRAGLIADTLKSRKGKTPARRTESERSEGRQKGIPDDADVTVKGQPANGTHRRNMTRVLDVADRLGAGPKATKALIEAVIIESQVQNLSYGDRDSMGILQVRVSTSGSAAKSTDIEWCVTKFLRDGFYHDPVMGSGGAMEKARKFPNASAGRVAQAVQGSGVPDAYDTVADEADGWLEAYGGASGSDSGGTGETTTRKKYEFSRGKPGEPEDSWTAIQRLADEVNWRAFMDAGTLYFISEDRLISSKAQYVIDEDTPGVHSIDFDIDQGRVGSEVRVTASTKFLDVRIGAVVALRGLGIANGRWLVSTVRQDLFEQLGEITLKAATPKLPEPATETVTHGSQAGDSSDPEMSGTLRDKILTVARKSLTKTSHFSRYDQNGALTDNPTPATGRTDCSQWVRACYLKAGAGDPGTWTGDMIAKGKRTSHPKPADLLINANHVELYVGGDKTYGHGSPPIDEGSVAYWRGRGMYFLTYSFLDE